MECCVRALRMACVACRQLSPWSREVSAWCIAQAGEIVMNASATSTNPDVSSQRGNARRWQHAKSRDDLPIGRPLLVRSYFPRFASAEIEHIYSIATANDTNLGFMLLLVICCGFTATFVAGDVAGLSLDGGMLRLGVRLGVLTWCIVSCVAFALRSACSPRVQLWMRTLAYIGLSLLINTRLAFEYSQVTYIRGLGVWSIGLKSATACVDVGFFRAIVFILIDSLANSLLNSVFRCGTEEDSTRWQVLMVVWFTGYALYADLTHRHAFARACELYVTRIVCAEASKLHRFLTDSTMAMICVHATDSSPPGTILYVSGACAALTGWSPSELRGQHPSSFVYPEDSSILAYLYTRIDDARGDRRHSAGSSRGRTPPRRASGRAEQRLRSMPAGLLRRFVTKLGGDVEGSELAVPLLSTAGTRFGFESLSRLDEVADASEVYIEHESAAVASDPSTSTVSVQPITPDGRMSQVWAEQLGATMAAHGTDPVDGRKTHQYRRSTPQPSALSAAMMERKLESPRAHGSAEAVAVTDIAVIDARLDSLRRLSVMRHEAASVADTDVVRSWAVHTRHMTLPNTLPFESEDEEVVVVVPSLDAPRQEVPRPPIVEATVPDAPSSSERPAAATKGAAGHVRWRRKDGTYVKLEVCCNPTADGIVCVYRDVWSLPSSA